MRVCVSVCVCESMLKFICQKDYHGNRVLSISEQTFAAFYGYAASVVSFVMCVWCPFYLLLLSVVRFWFSVLFTFSLRFRFVPRFVFLWLIKKKENKDGVKQLCQAVL